MQNNPVNRIDLLGLKSVPGIDLNNASCFDIFKYIQELYEYIYKRLDDLENYTKLYNNPHVIPRRNGGIGTWKGHQNEMKVTQERLMKAIEAYLKKCPPPCPCIPSKIGESVRLPIPEKPKKIINNISILDVIRDGAMVAVSTGLVVGAILTVADGPVLDVLAFLNFINSLNNFSTTIKGF